MSIGSQFAGLDMKNLIGGPLTAAADASILLAQSTADFINRVGFDAEQNVRKANFSFQRMEPDADGSMNQSEMKVEVPLLAIVPIPNLQIDEVNILFDMEVKQCEKSEQATDMSATINAGLQIGPLRVSITGSVASHSSNTRSSDNSAKYHVDVSATNHGTPEGLARVLDMMAANVAPTLISSKAVDGYGKELDSGRKARNQQMRVLREKKFQLENSARSAGELLDNKMKALLQKAASIEDSERLELAKPIVNAKKPEDMTDAEKLAAKQAEEEAEARLTDIINSWSGFRSVIKTIVSTAVDNATDDKGVFDVSKIGKIEEKTNLLLCAPYAGPTDPVLTVMQTLFEDAAAAASGLKQATKAMDANNDEYNKVMLKA